MRGGRRLSFAEFGNPHGRPVIWMHGTPGARRQIPVEAREFAEREGIRVIGIDRPGIGSSSPHLYESILDWTGDLTVLADTLGIGEMWVLGLSGGGPYALAAGAALPDRVRGVGVLGGVAPHLGPDAVSGGALTMAAHFAPFVSVARVPLSIALTAAIRVVKPIAGLFLDAFAAMQPIGDKRLLGRPEFRAMFLDDLLNGSRKQVSAPFADLLLFSRHWGFDLSEVTVPVLWWHGDDDNIIPHGHGEHAVARLPNARLITIEGESHLGGYGRVEEVLTHLLALGATAAPERAVAP